MAETAIHTVGRRKEAVARVRLIPGNGKIEVNGKPIRDYLRRDSLETAWDAYRSAWRAPEVGEFIAACRANPALLRHANETWELGRNRRDSLKPR